MTCHAVLVVSGDPEYLEDVDDALTEVGAFGVLADGVEGASRALEDGFAPEIVLLDPLLVGRAAAEEILLLLRSTPHLSTIPVVPLSSPRPPGTIERRSRRRADRDALIAALANLESSGSSPAP